MQSVPEALTALNAYPHVNAVRHDDGWITITSAQQEIPALVRILSQADVAIYQIIRQQMTLEDLFLGATKDASPPRNG